MGRDNPFQDRLDRFMASAEARDEEKLRADIERQKAEGRCDLVQMPQVETQPFRADLEVERSPIFVSNTFKGDSWTYERELVHPRSGEPVIQRVSVGRLHDKDRPRGALKQIHQEVFYKLLKLWGDQGYPIMEREDEDGEQITVGVFGLTAYELVTYLRGNDSVDHYRRVQTLLQDLASTPIVLEHEYSWQETSDRRSLKLLADVEWREKKVDPKTRRPKPDGFSKVTIYFSRTVTEGFLSKNVKQLLLGPYESLGAGGRGRRAEVARLLYPILDHELSSKESFNCTLTSLCERLGMTPQPYKSIRGRPFKQAVRQLTGKPILGERYQLQVQLRESQDGQDYVLEARRHPCQLNLPL
ncbi:MAG: hypothetical protein ABIP48_06090 [Planctomycetota bacterium]